MAKSRSSTRPQPSERTANLILELLPQYSRCKQQNHRIRHLPYRNVRSHLGPFRTVANRYPQIVRLLGWPGTVHARPMIGGDDRLLRFMAAAMCLFTEALYACEGVRLAWRNSHTRK